ncbi:MAG: hypothetical protein ACI8ZB_004871 [Desulforhopalus sp.]|jgi:uncharacterized protein (DUF1499 family)
MNALSIILIILTLLAITLILKNNSTPRNIGVTNGALSPVPSTPNAVSSQTSDKGRQVAPLPFRQDLLESITTINKILEEFEYIEIVKVEKNYIHAISTTKTMHFHDDIEFFFDERTKLIHFRSASRIGYSDMGVNRKRYNLLKNAYVEQD